MSKSLWHTLRCTDSVGRVGSVTESCRRVGSFSEGKEESVLPGREGGT